MTIEECIDVTAPFLEAPPLESRVKQRKLSNDLSAGFLARVRNFSCGHFAGLTVIKTH